MFSFLKSDTKDLLERLDNAIVECGKAIALYHEKNLIDDEIQEKMILNELEMFQNLLLHLMVQMDERDYCFSS